MNATDIQEGYLTLNENYTDYKLWVEDQSGNLTYMDPSWTAFNLEDYKAKGFKWVDASDSENTVVTDIHFTDHYYGTTTLLLATMDHLVSFHNESLSRSF